MPEDVVIRAENVGKRYVLNRQKTGNAPTYQRLSESLLHWAKYPYLKFRDRKSHRPPISATEDFWALRDVSFEIKRGEVLGIIGRNGAGKSTLLKILSRISEPTRGKITLRGRLACLLEVGTGFHPELTGRENIFLNGAILGMGKAEIRSRFDEIVAFAEIEKFLDTPVKRYSSGMYVRLAFSVAAHLEPEILIVDEVLAVGDADFQKKCLGRMGAVASEGRTVLIVSHQMDVIRRLANRAILLDNGRIQQDGMPEQVIRQYLAKPATATNFPHDSAQPSLTSFEIDSFALAAGRLEAKIRYASPYPIVRPSFALVIHSPDGTPAIGSSTLMHPPRRAAQNACCGVSTLSLDPLPLITGSYTVSLWLGDGVSPLQHLPHAASFDYQDPSPAEYPVNPSIFGTIKIHPNWQMELATPAA